jgi:hypothetical protein
VCGEGWNSYKKKVMKKKIRRVKKGGGITKKEKVREL